MSRNVSRSDQTTSTRTALSGIQYLRAIAALMVVIHHGFEQLPQYEPLFRGGPAGLLNLPAGVDIFFVISGFIMLVANRGTGPWQFLLRRVIRIVPLYWLLTLLLVAIASLKPALFRTTVLGTSHVLRSLLFIPYANPGHDGEMVPLLVPGWSLNFEMFFYLAFALLLCLPAAWRVGAAGMAFVLMLTLPALAPAGSLPGVLLFYASPRLLEFWLGMWIAQTWLSSPRVLPGPWPAALLALAGAAVLLLANLFSPMLPGTPGMLLFVVLPAAAVILGTVALERGGRIAEIGWCHWLGDASYSMYLCHIFALGAARVAWLALGLGRADAPHAAGFLLFGVACVFVLTWMCYTLVEAPVTRWLQGRLRRLSARRAPLSPEVSAAGGSRVAPKP